MTRAGLYDRIRTTDTLVAKRLVCTVIVASESDSVGVIVVDPTPDATVNVYAVTPDENTAGLHTPVADAVSADSVFTVLAAVLVTVTVYVVTNEESSAVTTTVSVLLPTFAPSVQLPTVATPLASVIAVAPVNEAPERHQEKE